MENTVELHFYMVMKIFYATFKQYGKAGEGLVHFLT